MFMAGARSLLMEHLQKELLMERRDRSTVRLRIKLSSKDLKTLPSPARQWLSPSPVTTSSSLPSLNASG